eukprot:scaffold24023_cov62-Phaeocystis_antarctica.AAC.3
MEARECRASRSDLSGEPRGAASTLALYAATCLRCYLATAPHLRFAPSPHGHDPTALWAWVRLLLLLPSFRIFLRSPEFRIVLPGFAQAAGR